MMSSLKKNLMESASGWRRPRGPTRLGPGRSWISAAPRRSTQERSPAVPSRTPSGTRTRRARMSQSAAVNSGSPGRKEHALLQQDAALQFLLRHFSIALDFLLHQRAQARRRPVAAAPAESDGEEQQQLPVRADLRLRQECPLQTRRAALDV